MDHVGLYNRLIFYYISINRAEFYVLRGTSDSVAIFSALSNPADTQNVSSLGLCGIGIFARKASYQLGTFNQ